MQIREKVTIQKIYALFLCFHVILLIIGAFTVKEDKFNLGEENSYVEIFPDTHEKKTDGVQQYIFHNTEQNRMNAYLMFYTNHQEVHVYTDGELIYERNKIDSMFGHTSGSIWNMMEFPSDAKEIIVTTKAIYPSGIDNLHTFYQGNGLNILRQIIRNSILSLIVCIVLFVLGICMILYWLLVCRKTQVAKEVLYMGLLLLFVGIWALGEEKSIMILFDNRVYASYITYIMLILSSITFMLFINQYTGADGLLLHKFLATYAFGGTFLMMILLWFHIMDFKQTVVIVHIIFLFDLLYLLLGLLRKRHKKKSKKTVYLNVAGLTILTATVIFELYAYYIHLINMQAFAMLGLLAYVIILAIEIGSNASEKIEEIRKAEIYKELAEKDMLTQCFNRNAYTEAIQKECSDNTYLVMFDLNNLKKCNDTLGHMEGDRYIIDSASLIKEIFGNYGNVFRIGGDEFCVIMENTSDEIILSLLQQLILKENAYNKQSKTVYMQIATGYAKFDKKMETNLDQTRCRADMLMYENKKRLKESPNL
ncbi:MAG: GGDEF domain-containing protein [Lachnospiraceae bacterium]|nr:GGDEF domain-containing protein [Lachnospiraceae bacterium]